MATSERAPGERHACRDLKSDLLVGGPLGVDTAELGEALKGLGRGRAGIAHPDHRAGFPSALRDSLISRQQRTAHERPLTGRRAAA